MFCFTQSKIKKSRSGVKAMSDDKNAESKKETISKLERLKQRQKKINSDIRKEQNKENLLQRRADTRRKIIMGALALSHMEKDAEFRAVCERLQREGITKDTDRELFRLPPIPGKIKTETID